MLPLALFDANNLAFSKLASCTRIFSQVNNVFTTLCKSCSSSTKEILHLTKKEINSYFAFFVQIKTYICTSLYAESMHGIQ